MPMQAMEVSTPFRFEYPIRRNTISLSLEAPPRQLSNMSTSPFTPGKTLEYTLTKSGNGVTMHDVTGTPNSIFSKFKAQRHQYTPPTPQTPTNPWVNIPEDLCHLEPPMSMGGFDFRHEALEDEYNDNPNEHGEENTTSLMEDK